MANLLTTIRLFLVVPIAWAFANPDFISALVLCALIFVAIASDYFDGIVARATNTSSPWGQLFDHGTDFVFVTCCLGALTYSGVIHPFLPILIIIAFSQYVFDSYFLFRDKQLRMSFLGRWNGVLYFAPLVLVAISRLSFLAIVEPLLVLSVSFLGLGLTASTIASIIDRSLAPLRLKSGS
jgi:phosphatidylglycerophosphate synthase